MIKRYLKRRNEGQNQRCVLNRIIPIGQINVRFKLYILGSGENQVYKFNASIPERNYSESKKYIELPMPVEDVRTWFDKYIDFNYSQNSISSSIKGATLLGSKPLVNRNP